MGVAPARCLHVGDSLHSDVRGAAALGITTAWVVRGVRIGDVADGVPAPDHTLTSLRELTAIL
jgi:FMN phosphatase YigB (HAD superfamily)